MVEAGFPYEVDVTKSSNLVFEFPVASPEGATCTKEVGAMEQLRLWKMYQDYWSEHKPSITVYYRDDEFLEVANWMWKNFDSLSGISLLPYSDHIYKQSPYQEITKEEYEAMAKDFPTFDWEAAAKFEQGMDTTVGSQELACSAAGGCELP
jgi:ribonucleoside-diphosphate reductase alpha chain